MLAPYATTERATHVWYAHAVSVKHGSDHRASTCFLTTTTTSHEVEQNTHSNPPFCHSVGTRQTAERPLRHTDPHLRLRLVHRSSAVPSFAGPRDRTRLTCQHLDQSFKRSLQNDTKRHIASEWHHQYSTPVRTPRGYHQFGREDDTADDADHTTQPHSHHPPPALAPARSSPTPCSLASQAGPCRIGVLMRPQAPTGEPT